MPHSAVVQKHSEVIHTNQRHPFLTLEHGFVPVSQLTVGMQVLNADGTVGTVTGWKVVSGTQLMYNLDVAQDHTYTVGAGQWVVHNCGSTIEEVWHEGSFNSSAESAQYHFNKHGAEVGATSLEQYINKAKGFLQNRRVAIRIPVSGDTEGVIRYIKRGLYIDVAPDDRIISFGKR